jgi:hypothetical protein
MVGGGIDFSWVDESTLKLMQAQGFPRTRPTG